MDGKTGLPIIAFSCQEDWERWLDKNHESSNGLWIKFAKKASGILSITPAEALDVALCYGWIDGQRDKFDENYYLNKYTHRRPKSLWSKRNREIVARLEKENRMKPVGIKEVEAAKADGRWEKAYDSPANMKIPGDFLKELAKDKKAEAFFKTLNKTNQYAVAWRLQTAKKPETRERRMKKILEMMEKGEKFH